MASAVLTVASAARGAAFDTRQDRLKHRLSARTAGTELAHHDGHVSPDTNSWYTGHVLRPASWTGLAGESPVPVGTGAPGSRPRFVVERRRAKRGVRSLFGGSKCAGRSVTRTLQPRQRNNGGAEPLMSRRRPCPASLGPGLVRRVFPGYGWRHVHIVWFGAGEARLLGLRRAKTKGISRW